jgi:hypothetical protein
MSLLFKELRELSNGCGLSAPLNSYNEISIGFARFQL